MSWMDRLKKDIRLFSPEGETFTALWIKNERSFSKRLGLFDYPKVVGTRVQDMGSGAVGYPLTIYFEGSDNDLDAEKFFKACIQMGVWTIDHPVRGILELQLVSFSEDIDYIDNGNLTKIETEWIEPLKETTEQSTAQKQFALGAGVDSLNSSGAAQLTETVEQSKAAQVFTLAVSVQKTVTTVTEKLKSLYEKSAEINAQISSVRRSITDTVTQTVIDVAGLAGEIQHLIQLPTLISNDISSRLSLYSDMASDLLGLSPEGTTADAKNTAAIQEAALMATIGALAQIVASGRLETRRQAIEAAAELDTLYKAITDGLDATQTNFTGQDIDNQFFSQSSSATDAALLVGNALEYLLEASYDLLIEKRIVLTLPRAPIEIAITEYGTLGPNDENFDKFIESNELKGNDIILLPAGREVVVYV